MPRRPRQARNSGPEPTTPAARGRRLTIVLGLGLLAAVALIYDPVRHFGFVPLDDPNYVPNNPHVVGGLTWANVSWAFTSRWASYWIPLTWVSYMTEVQFFGVRPDALHVTNVLLHAANTLLLFGWLRRATGAVGRSAMVAALFAVHPLHVESVAWITERKDVLSTFFLLLALAAYTAYTRQRTLARYLTACGLAVAGLLAKPMLVTLPFLLLLCDVWPLERVTFDVRSRDTRARWRSLIWEKAPLLAIAAVASALAFVTQQRGGAMIASDVFPLGLRVENALVSGILYLWQTLRPVDLIVWYAYPESIPIWQVAGALALLAAVSLAVVRAATRPYLAVGWFWYLGTLVPVSGLVQVGLQPRADRFTYVPLIGIFIVVCWGATDLAARWRSRRVLLAVTGIAATVACTALSRDQVAYWQDGITLWTHAAEVTSGAGGAQAQFELAKALTTAGRVEEAVAHFTEATRAKPDWAGAHGVFGLALVRAGRAAEAKTEFEAALRLDPGQPEIENSLGALLANDGQIPAALPHFEAAVRLDPASESAHVNLGIALARLGRRDEAIREIMTALRLDPDNAQTRQILDTVTRSGKNE